MKIGVIVGRFQTPRLSRGHMRLIESALLENDRIIILVGTNVVRSKHNPFDFDTRKQMIISTAFSSHGWEDKVVHDKSKVTVISINDMKHNQDWVANLDKNIQDRTNKDDEVTLYGSRDSFLNIYNENGGSYSSKNIEELKGISATKLRTLYSKESIHNLDRRIGYLKGVYNEYKAAYGVVDAIITDEDNNILLGYKNDQGYCLFGGFIDPADESLEETILREVKEEAGISLNKATYLFSRKCNDWRYKRSIQPMSSIFHLPTNNTIMRSAVAGDDINGVVIVNLNDVHEYFHEGDTHLKYIKEYIKTI